MLITVKFAISNNYRTFTERMRLRKCSEGALPTSIASNEATQASISKIIESYEQLLTSLNSKIGQLTIDIQLTQQKLSLTETRYVTLVGFLDQKGKVNIEKLIDKVDELQKKFINQNAEIVRLKGRILKKDSDFSDILASKTESTLRNELGTYFNFERIRENEEIMKRSRKNSLSEQENSIPWERALEQYSENGESPTKFKQKTLPILKKFIPHEQRHKVWPFVFDNKLGINEELYIQLTERRNQGGVDQHVKSQIQRDIMRSFSCKMNILFENSVKNPLQSNNKEKLSADVQEILEIFHLFRPDVSYVQGMTYPVIILSLVVGKIEAFKIFSNLVVGNKFVRNMYTFDSRSIQIQCKVFDYLLRDSQPDISKHLQILGIKSQMFLIQWFFTLFSRGLTLESTLKVWDMYGYQTELVLYRICLAIFQIIGKRLLVEKYEQTVGLIQSYWATIDETRLLQLVSNSRLTSEKLTKVFSKVSKDLNQQNESN